MGLTGSIIVYVIIWWIFFFSLTFWNSIQQRKNLKIAIEGSDPGAPKNPKIAKKFLITTIITSILFVVIYYM